MTNDPIGTGMSSTPAVRRKRGSYGLKISDLVDYTRLLLGLVSYFFRFRSS